MTSADGFAGLQPHAAGSILAHQHLLHGSGQAYLGTGLVRRRRQCVTERTEPAQGQRYAARAGAAQCRQAIQQCHDGTGGARAEVGSQHRIERDCPLHQRRTEIVGQQVVDVHPADAQQFAQVATTQTTQAPAQVQEVNALRPAVRAEFRRHHLECRPERRCKTPQPLQQLRISLAVAANPRTLDAAVRLQEHRCCRPRQRHGRQIERSPTQSVRFQSQVRNHPGRHLVQQVGAGGDPEARREFARHRRSAHAIGRFQHQHPVTCTGQVAGAYQAVVPAADDDRVVVRSCPSRPAHACSAMRRSRSIARAAFAPGAPMTPPPGWVLEPHRYSPRSGARYCA